MFPESKQALINLQQTLQCTKCLVNSKDLLRLGQCEHWFCRSCAVLSAGNLCPICGIPTVASETRVDLQLSNVASLCSYMMQLIDGNISYDNYGVGSIISPKAGGDLVSDSRESDANLRLCDDKRDNCPDVTGSSEKEGVENEKETFAISKCNDSTLPQKSKEIVSGSTGKKKISSKAGVRKLYRKDDIAKLCGEEDVFLGGEQIKERSNKPRKSVAKILDTLNDVPPELKKRRCENSVETPGNETMATEVVPLNAKGKQYPWRKRSSLNENTTPQSNGKSNLVKNTPKDSSVSAELTLANATPLSSKKRQSVDADKSNLCKRNAKGEMPLQVATIKMDFGEVNRLLEAGANPNVKDNAGWTPLHEAIGQGCTDIASLLITNGASVNAPGMDNESPLHDAVINQHVESVRLLLSNGASVYARNVHGVTPLDLAKTDEIKSLLLNASKDSFVSVVDLPMLDESAKPLVLTGTNLTKAQSKLLIQYSRVLQGKIVDQVTPEVTHLITSVNEDGASSRTMKYLSAVLTGKWIVNLEWLEECARLQERASEREFQVSGCLSHPDSYAPKKGLENRLKQLPPLFDGCQVFFYGKFEISGLKKEDLASLVKQGGGVVLKREPHLHNLDDYPYTRPYHSQNTSLADCTIYKIYDDACRNPPSVEAQRMSCLPASWLLDTIASFSFLEKTNYIKS